MKTLVEFIDESHDKIDMFDLVFVAEEIANVSGDLSLSTKSSSAGDYDTISGPDGKTKKKTRKKKKCELDCYEGKMFFVSPELFEKLKSGKVRGDRWSKYIDEDSELGLNIKKYSLRNPSKPVVIQNEESGEIVFLRRKQTDGRLRHNKKC